MCRDVCGYVCAPESQVCPRATVVGQSEGMQMRMLLSEENKRQDEERDRSSSRGAGTLEGGLIVTSAVAEQLSDWPLVHTFN